MDAFGDDRLELTGSLITMEFGAGGRITQLWASDPALPDEGEDFQFVLPPLTLGEESAENYYPGTILIGARSNPDDYWVVSRNTQAHPLYDMSPSEDEDMFDPGHVGFSYDFPLLPDIEAKGRFREVPGVVPQIVWDLEIRNRGRKSLEIGELGFPLAFNNFYDGFGWSDEQLRRLWHSRLYVHKFIGGAASWVFAQRMTAEAPGLLVFPGADTQWEFFAHVPSSLNTPYQWDGIPVVYAYSKATVEREGWNSWWNEHTSLILEPGDAKALQMRFVPAERDKQDGVYQTLVACSRPAIRLLPSAVAPIEVGIAIEVSGTVPKRFAVSRQAELQTDADEEGGFCFVRPAEPGPLRVSFEDSEGRISHAHLMFTEPIETLIKKRASWIAGNQVHLNQTSVLFDAIVMTNTSDGAQVTDPEEYASSSGIESSLADALYLAEKNTLYPQRSEVRIIDDFISEFLLDDVQNPSDMSVSSVLGDASSAGTYAGRPLNYPHVFNLYAAMYRVASTFGETAQRPDIYLDRAYRTAMAMFRFGWRNYVLTVGLLGYARVYELLEDLREANMVEQAQRLEDAVTEKAEEIVKQQYPYAGESVLDTSGFEDVFSAGLFLQNDDHMERTVRCAYAARSLAPSWWWYGSDKRSWDGADSTPVRALIDRGEACLAQTTIPNSLMFFSSLDRDYLALPDAHMRLAFGGMIGPWALVRKDGAASMCYCPDLSSKHDGYNPYSGASGLGYYHYLRGAGAYVLPNGAAGTFTFGCHFEQDDGRYTVRPWDGVGRRVIMRQIGAEFHLGFGKIVELRLDVRKRWVEIDIANTCNKKIETFLKVGGMWGVSLTFGKQTYACVDGAVKVSVALPPEEMITLIGKVTK